MNKLKKQIPLGIFLLTAAAFFYALILVNWSVKDLFITPDQQGRLLLQKKEYNRAAAVFIDPMQRGVALYRDGNFKEAAAAFGRDDSLEARYNRANALLMAGKYDDAITVYEEILILKPDWLAARKIWLWPRFGKKECKDRMMMPVAPAVNSKPMRLFLMTGRKRWRPVSRSRLRAGRSFPTRRCGLCGCAGLKLNRLIFCGQSFCIRRSLRESQVFMSRRESNSEICAANRNIVN